MFLRGFDCHFVEQKRWNQDQEAVVDVVVVVAFVAAVDEFLHKWKEFLHQKKWTVLAKWILQEKFLIATVDVDAVVVVVFVVVVVVADVVDVAVVDVVVVVEMILDPEQAGWRGLD